jgi:hypothetical protein
MECINVLRAINSAQSNFFQLCNGYSADLPTLGAVNYLLPDLTGAATLKRHGYLFTLRKSSAPGTVVVAGRVRQCDGSATHYYTSAIPLAGGNVSEIQ